jgi:hypothetical protein
MTAIPPSCGWPTCGHDHVATATPADVDRCYLVEGHIRARAGLMRLIVIEPVAAWVASLPAAQPDETGSAGGPIGCHGDRGTGIGPGKLRAERSFGWVLQYRLFQGIGQRPGSWTSRACGWGYPCYDGAAHAARAVLRQARQLPEIDRR